MAKVLTDLEMIDIVKRAPNEIDCADAYRHFLEDLTELIINHFGADVGEVCYRGDDDLGWTCSFHINECVPGDGGVFKDYDTDVTWKNGIEK